MTPLRFLKGLLVRLPLLCCLCFGAALLAAPAAHAEAAALPTSPPGGSVQAFAEALAAAVKARADAEAWRTPVRVLLDDGRGVDLQKARTALVPRIKKALKNLWAADAPLKARLALSEENGKLWAVIVVEGPGLDAPSTIVVSAFVDRELSLALGAVGRQAQGRFLLERKGVLPTTTRCPVLDTALVDLDGDPALELAVLTRCGVEVFSVDDSPRLQRLAGPFPLPERRWPRVALGWLVAEADKGDRGHTVWAATSAGHSVFVDVRAAVKDAVKEAPDERVPLRSVSNRDGPLALHWRFGSPVLSLPLVSPGGIDIVVPGLPLRVRDLVRWPGSDGLIFVAEDGSLLARDEDAALQSLAPERIGDRILLVDVDADGEPELVTSAASSPGEPDQLVLRRVGAGLETSTVLLKSPLSGGSIVGIAAGHVDYDARLDVLIIEELASGEAQVWRLEHAE